MMLKIDIFDTPDRQTLELPGVQDAQNRHQTALKDHDLGEGRELPLGRQTPLRICFQSASTFFG